MSPAGKVEQRGTVWTLARTVKALNRATGIEWPYQVIHRALKRATAWAEAYTPAGEPGALISVIERDADPARPIQVWEDEQVAANNQDLYRRAGLAPEQPPPE
jgi:hypothetical protein